jgi:hypothetical protein
MLIFLFLEFVDLPSKNIDKDVKYNTNIHGPRRFSISMMTAYGW